MSWKSPHGTPLPDWRQRTLMMGIINITPDSFSDGGEVTDIPTAINKAQSLIDQGADILDLGAESTRPGSSTISEEIELARLLPIIVALRKKFPQMPLSVDTYKSAVAKVAIESGADIINDVEGARWEVARNSSAMAQVAAQLNCPLILMHRRKDTNYKDFWPEILGDLKLSIHFCLEAGVAPEQLWLDPGFGFGKTPQQNLMLVRNLEKVTALGFPVMLGASRKSTLGLVLNEKNSLHREEGNEVTATWGIAQGCHMIRAHDFSRLRKVIQMADALRRGQTWSEF
jgi:dihydropteroate synthase